MRDRENLLLLCEGCNKNISPTKILENSARDISKKGKSPRWYRSAFLRGIAQSLKYDDLDGANNQQLLGFLMAHDKNKTGCEEQITNGSGQKALSWGTLKFAGKKCWAKFHDLLAPHMGKNNDIE